MEQTDTPVESGATESDTVPIPEASDEELHSFLDDFKKGGAPIEADGEESEEEEGPTNTETEVKQEAKPQATPEADKNQGDSEEKVSISRSELRALQEQLIRQEQEKRQQEAFIQRRNQEYGDLKRQLEANRQKLEQDLEEAESPADQRRLMRQLDQVEDGLKQVEQNQDEINQVHTTYATVSKHINLNEVPVDDVVGVLQSDGFNDREIQDFMSNPWRGSPGALVQLFKRAKDQRELREHKEALTKVVPYLKGLLEKAKEQRAQPERLIQQVDKALKAGPTITGRSGNSSTKSGLVDVDPTKLSDDELRELGKKLNVIR